VPVGVPTEDVAAAVKVTEPVKIEGLTEDAREGVVDACPTIRVAVPVFVV
jgi:hypothetical protein